MKATTIYKGCRFLFRNIALLSLPLMMNGQVNKSKVRAGFGVQYSISANGYGGELSPVISLTGHSNEVLAGIIIQNRRSNLAGVNASWLHFVTGPAVHPDRPCEPGLFFMLSTSYHFGALLGNRALWEETRTNKSAQESGVFAYKFQSAEVFAGAGVAMFLGRHLKWMGTAALGGYHTFNMPGNCTLRYNSCGIGLALSTTLVYDLGHLAPTAPKAPSNVFSYP